MKFRDYSEYLLRAAAVSSTTALMATNLTGFTALQPTLSEVCMASIGVWLAHHGVKKYRDHHDAAPTPKPAADDAPAWVIPTTDSWCQWCDDLHPTKEFSLDILGRWVCLECRRLVDPDYQMPPEPEPPAAGSVPAKCVSCHYEAATFFVKLADGKFVHMCQNCINIMTDRNIKPSKGGEVRLEEVRNRLADAEAAKKAARRGLDANGFPLSPGTQEVAGGEYVRSMTGHQVMVNGVDKGGIVHVDGMNCRVKVSHDVLALGRVIADGMSAEIFIAGNVGAGAKILAVGMNARIVICGHIAADARIWAEGMNASVEYGDADSRNTVIMAKGMNSKVSQRSKPRDSTFDVQPGTVWETPEAKRPTGEDKPPCEVCGAPSYYYLAIVGGGHEHRCVRCSASVRNYTYEERVGLMKQTIAANEARAATQDQIDQLAAIHQVPAPQVGEDSAASTSWCRPLR